MSTPQVHTKAVVGRRSGILEQHDGHGDGRSERRGRHEVPGPKHYQRRQRDQISLPEKARYDRASLGFSEVPLRGAEGGTKVLWARISISRYLEFALDFLPLHFPNVQVILISKFQIYTATYPWIVL